ncbi:stage VI sporulation protein F [Texcoconibacillus texcoconensis]|uniref:Uncharacterized protein n=1 Tax=Texcoconibacillus texcoconensis TaxID=1095777 RepID=A0A840QNF3_9BACI|nr:hypothetical protein [Texcoconibacillus texcoconensis]
MAKPTLNDYLGQMTDVDEVDLLHLAQLVSETDLGDEGHIRQLIAQVADVACVDVDRRQEDELVNAIMNREVPQDFSMLSHIFDKNQR